MIQWNDYYPGMSREEVHVVAEALTQYIENTMGDGEVSPDDPRMQAAGRVLDQLTDYIAGVVTANNAQESML